jgi:long-chain fatty acid transport protein
LFAALGLALAWGEASAHAGGLQLSSRGVRPTARGGAFVAGADGLGAFGFNPAGLAALARDAHRRSLLVDFGYVSQSVRYRRIDSGLNQREPVENQAPGLPIPTLGVSFDLGERAVLAVGVYAPYAALGKYPDEGPQRYSIVDLSESLMAITEVAVGYWLTDTVRVGAGLQNMGFFMASSIVFSGCPGQTVCAPEDPEFDAMGKVTQLSVFNPSGVVGAQVDLGQKIRLGASFQLPFFVSGKGSFETRLPPSGFFDGAEVVGDRADVSFTWPAALRMGVEAQPVDRLKVELAGSIEFWSLHDEFLIEPKDVRIENAPGVGTYEVGPMRIPRNFQNSYAVHLGVEGQPTASLPLSVLAGYSFETAAAPDPYLSVMTVDGSRHLIAGGVGYRLGEWNIHASAGVVAMSDRRVSPDEGVAPQINPIRPNDPEVYVNWGEYSSSWFLAGAGVSRGF